MMKYYKTIIDDSDFVLTDRDSMHRMVDAIYPKPQQKVWYTHNGIIHIRSFEKFKGGSYRDDVSVISITEHSIPEVGDEFMFSLHFSPSVCRSRPRKKSVDKYPSNFEFADNFIKTRLDDSGMTGTCDVTYVGHEHVKLPYDIPIFRCDGYATVTDSDQFAKVMMDGIKGCNLKSRGLGIIEIDR